MATQDDLNTPAIAVVGLVGAIVVFAIIVLLMVVFYRAESRQRYARDGNRPYSPVSQLVTDQQVTLARYGWVNQRRGIAHIPVTRAMDLVVAELSRDPEAVVTGVVPVDARPSEDGKGDENVP